MFGPPPYWGAEEVTQSNWATGFGVSDPRQGGAAQGGGGGQWWAVREAAGPWGGSPGSEASTSHRATPPQGS